jgi:hypothetical protein
MARSLPEIIYLWMSSCLLHILIVLPILNVQGRPPGPLDLALLILLLPIALSVGVVDLSHLLLISTLVFIDLVCSYFFYLWLCCK